MTSIEAKEKYGDRGGYLTVGQLKKELENYPDDALVVSQRVEDMYYEGVDVSGITGILEDGSVGTLPPGSKASGWDVITKPDNLYSGKDNEYTPVWSIYRYGDDFHCLFLDLHY